MYKVKKSDVSEVKGLLWLIVFLTLAMNRAPIIALAIPAIFTIYYTIRIFIESRKEASDQKNQ